MTNLIKFGAKGLAFIFWNLPVAMRLIFAEALAILWVDILGFRGFTLLKNLTIAFPEASKEERHRIARESVRNLAINLFEFLSIPHLDLKFAEKEVQFHGYENYLAAQAKGKGVLMLSLHMGNGDFGCAVMSLRGIRINLISKKFKMKWINDFWFGVRESLGTKFIDPHNAKNAFDIMGALRRKECVTFVLDQFMGRPFGIETTFFGRKTGTAYGLALFAAKTGAPVLPVYTYRDAEMKTHVVFAPELPTIAVSVDNNRDLQSKQNTQQYNDWMESVIRSHPEQWMWIHRRWKKWE